MANAGRAPRPLVIYVTSHGFGHLNRTVSVINRIPVRVPVIVRGDPNLFDHWHERLRRPAELEASVSDVGAINPPGNSADTDPAATMRLAAQVIPEALARAENEASRLIGAGAVLCDAPPMPLAAAALAGVPGFLLGNFTWADIYAPYARKLGGSYTDLVRSMRLAYRKSVRVFRCQPALEMNWLDRKEDVGLVGTAGSDRQAELKRTFQLGARDRVVYCYFGRYGQEDLEWDRMATMLDDRIHFVGFHGPPPGVAPPSNLHVVDAKRWTGADLAASCDLIVAKAGYGTACEAMLAGKPILFPPRTNFAEHRSLATGLKAWGGGLPVARRAFDRLRIEAQIRRALQLSPGPPPFRTDGSAVVAERLTRVCQAQDERIVA